MELEFWNELRYLKVLRVIWTSRISRTLNNIVVSRTQTIQWFLGPKQDHKAAREFILQVYLSSNPDADRMCYSHFTAATGHSVASSSLQ